MKLNRNLRNTNNKNKCFSSHFTLFQFKQLGLNKKADRAFLVFSRSSIVKINFTQTTAF